MFWQLSMLHRRLYCVYARETLRLSFEPGVLGCVIGMAIAPAALVQSTLFFFTQLNVPALFSFVQLCRIKGWKVVCDLAASAGPVPYVVQSPSITVTLRLVL